MRMVSCNIVSKDFWSIEYVYNSSDRGLFFNINRLVFNMERVRDNYGCLL